MIRIMSDWRTGELKVVSRTIRAKGRTYERFTISGHYEAGKRSQRLFKSRKEAESLLTLLKRERHHHGLKATEMPMRLRVEAHECLRRLEPYGTSLTQVTDWFIAKKREEARIRKSENVGHYLDQFCHLKETRLRSGELSPETLRNIRSRTKTIRAAFGELPIRSITRGQILSFLENLTFGPQTRSHYRALLFEFFNYAMQKEWVEINPVAALGRLRDLAKPRDREIGILTVDETQELLEEARLDSKAGQLVPYLVLGLFAGLRPYEALRIRWEAIDFGQGNIEVGRNITKTRQTRHVEMNETARAWLQPYRRAEGLVTGESFIGYRKAFERVRQKCGWLAGHQGKQVGGLDRPRKSWTPDALRHSFASYWLAVNQNRAKLAEQMGNSEAVIGRHYRKPIAPKKAEAYWLVKPPKISAPLATQT